MPKHPTVFDQVVQISEDYLGPAGERFIRRQVTTHLKIEPEKLRKDDLRTLIDWLSLSFALLTSNHQDVEDFTQSLYALTYNYKR